MLWKILFTVPAQSHLQSIKASRIRAQIRRRIDALAGDPEKQGKPLGDELFDLRSVRAVKERYRIIYRVKKEKIIVLIVAIGIRKEGDKKEVYALAQKLARLGLLDLVAPFISPSIPDTDDEPEEPEA
jgi:mRNA interferase RelE/StbE